MFPSDVAREQEYNFDVLGENDTKISPLCGDAGVLRLKDKTPSLSQDSAKQECCGRKELHWQCQQQ